MQDLKQSWLFVSVHCYLCLVSDTIMFWAVAYCNPVSWRSIKCYKNNSNRLLFAYCEDKLYKSVDECCICYKLSPCNFVFWNFFENSYCNMPEILGGGELVNILLDTLYSQMDEE